MDTSIWEFGHTYFLADRGGRGAAFILAFAWKQKTEGFNVQVFHCDTCRVNGKSAKRCKCGTITLTGIRKAFMALYKHESNGTTFSFQTCAPYWFVKLGKLHKTIWAFGSSRISSKYMLFMWCDMRYLSVSSIVQPGTLDVRDITNHCGI